MSTDYGAFIDWLATKRSNPETTSDAAQGWRMSLIARLTETGVLPSAEGSGMTKTQVANACGWTSSATGTALKQALALNLCTRVPVASGTGWVNGYRFVPPTLVAPPP